MPNSSYLTKQLIAYIGNKRTLLPFLSDVFDSFELGDNPTFSDPFAGTGAVSRLAKSKGFKVYSNDWELYSYIANSCFIGINESEKESLFKSRGGIEAVFKEFNSLLNDFTPYVSKHYAPKDTGSADYITERLFYTRENAIFIDRARTYIEELYPEGDLGELEIKEKNMLLTSLLYEVSTHANTSGVFKACHKGFGGHGKDALGRIMKPMVMEIPNLINSSHEHSVSRMDALDFVKGISTDICYLDPPYNMHQYGSNYFMLNSVALWDRPNVNTERGEDGRFKEKAGIRKDWKKTKSPYCYKSQAPKSFSDLMDSINSRYIILSYNTEGIIPFNELFDIMERHGKVSLHIKDYVLYKGGKQSLARKNHNMELLLVVDRKGTSDGNDRVKVQRFLNEKKVLTKLKMPFHPEKISTIFSFTDKGLCSLDSDIGEVKVFKGYKFISTPDDLNLLSDEKLEELDDKLSDAICLDNREETLVVISLIKEEGDSKSIKKLQKRLLVVYKKLAFKKYIDIFKDISGILNDHIRDEDSRFTDIETKIREIEHIAQLRFKG